MGSIPLRSSTTSCFRWSNTRIPSWSDMCFIEVLSSMAPNSRFWVPQTWDQDAPLLETRTLPSWKPGRFATTPSWRSPALVASLSRPPRLPEPHGRRGDGEVPTEIGDIYMRLRGYIYIYMYMYVYIYMYIYIYIIYKYLSNWGYYIYAIGDI